MAHEVVLVVSFEKCVFDSILHIGGRKIMQIILDSLHLD